MERKGRRLNLFFHEKKSLERMGAFRRRTLLESPLTLGFHPHGVGPARMPFLSLPPHLPPRRERPPY